MIRKSTVKFARGSTEKSNIQTSRIILRQNILTILSSRAVPVGELFPVEQASELIVETFTENLIMFLLRFLEFRFLLLLVKLSYHIEVIL